MSLFALHTRILNLTRLTISSLWLDLGSSPSYVIRATSISNSAGERMRANAYVPDTTAQGDLANVAHSLSKADSLPQSRPIRTTSDNPFSSIGDNTSTPITGTSNYCHTPFSSILNNMALQLRKLRFCKRFSHFQQVEAPSALNAGCCLFTCMRLVMPPVLLT